ncbi:SDR family NAD(P)-dependent oxidoreductase [Hamadaea tsunoensis]|uniref:SDR family NAD(P)-dependent oxidoreductase n=1 Tax=Hamadaea tsunoensis TaxID=53368 RepID=UPI00068806DD|nr:SDR family NAD(P)-dependent oxidoreductase [Hamadaea tsunoensis]
MRVVVADLATDAGLAALFEATGDLEVGMVVANAALSPIGPFVRAAEDDLLRALDLNARAPMRLARHYLPAMADRRRGGFVVMSSLAGQQGSPGLAAYAGTKAFGAVLAESLWAELRPSGVDVLACVAGAVATPGLAQTAAKRAPGTVSPETVVAAAFRALGKRPVTVPGGLMRWSSAFMRRVLPRRTAVTIMGNASKDVLG